MIDIKKLDEATINLFILFIFVVIIIMMGAYFYRVSRMNSKQCKYTDTLYNKSESYINSIVDNAKAADYALYDYYIKTAYNACSGGGYKNDFVNVCHLKNVLKTGARCLDFEIYSVNNRPVVSTSTANNFHVKETYNSVDFADVINTIQYYAFSDHSPNKNDPILIHLRIKSNNLKIYAIMTDIMKSCPYMIGKDYNYENNGYNIGSEPLKKFKGKILVIVDKSNDTFMNDNGFYEYVNLTSNSVFMRSYKYKDVKDTADADEIIRYNKTRMSIVFPDIGPEPPNSNGLLAREAGCQMIAMRYQAPDELFQENTMFFDKCGYAFCLKPERLRQIPVTIKPPVEQKKSLSYATRDISNNFYKFQI
jgi:hypothetical protein